MVNQEKRSSVVHLVYRTHNEICDPIIICETENRAASIARNKNIQASLIEVDHGRSEYCTKPITFLHDPEKEEK